MTRYVTKLSEESFTVVDATGRLFDLAYQVEAGKCSCKQAKPCEHELSVLAVREIFPPGPSERAIRAE